jgi:hypothetical protein
MSARNIESLLQGADEAGTAGLSAPVRPWFVKTISGYLAFDYDLEDTVRTMRNHRPPLTIGRDQHIDLVHEQSLGGSPQTGKSLL